VVANNIFHCTHALRDLQVQERGNRREQQNAYKRDPAVFAEREPDIENRDPNAVA
jgi:hypothetical protein